MRENTKKHTRRRARKHTPQGKRCKRNTELNIRVSRSQIEVRSATSALMVDELTPKERDVDFVTAKEAVKVKL
jgi:hypothetical protein